MRGYQSGAERANERWIATGNDKASRLAAAQIQPATKQTTEHVSALAPLRPCTAARYRRMPSGQPGTQGWGNKKTGGWQGVVSDACQPPAVRSASCLSDYTFTDSATSW